MNMTFSVDEVAIVIPARFESTRFPGKPLVKIHGYPMIQWVWKRCIEALPQDQVFIATDSDIIAEAVAGFGGHCIMTSSDCLTGTDRVAEVANKLDRFNRFINVQGDEPMVLPEDILKVIKMSFEFPEFVINGVSEITDHQEYFSRNTPKVVFNSEHEMLYISRSPIPMGKSGNFHRSYKQVCIYSFNRKHLNYFGLSTVKAPLEGIEDIEILRLLENGHKIKVCHVSSSIAVDIPEDIEKVLKSW